jgi:phospholipid N-methyltransferase
MSNGSFCVAVEPNKSFCDFLNNVDSRMRVICDFAENASEKILELYGPADVILAGLPFSLMSEGTISVILKEAKNLLVSDGELRLFFYAHSLLVPKVQRMLDSVFEAFSLTWTSVSWNNIPPMAVVRCLN